MFQKNPRVRKNFCPQFWGWKWLRQFYGRLEKLRSFCRKTSMRIKFLALGGVILGFFGGRVPILLFLWARGIYFKVLGVSGPLGGLSLLNLKASHGSTPRLSGPVMSTEVWMVTGFTGWITCLLSPPHYYEAGNDYTNKSETTLLCNKCPRKVLISKRKMVRKTTRNFPENF